MTRFLLGILTCFLVINSIQFSLFAYDKMIAGKVHARIPEVWFWRIAWAGGALGAWLAMESFRHKTQHRAFSKGMPWLALVQLSILSFIVGRFLS